MATSTGQFLSGAADAFKQLLANQQEQKRTLIEQERADADRTAKEAETKHNQDALQQAHDQFQAQHKINEIHLKLASAFQNLQKIQVGHKLANDSAETGILPPGFQQTGNQAVDAQGNPLQMSAVPGATRSIQTGTVPGVGTADENGNETPMQMSIPSQQLFFENQGRRNATVNAPAYAQQIELKKQEQQAEAERRLQEILATGEETRKSQASKASYDENLRKQQDDAAEKRAQIQANATKYAADSRSSTSRYTAQVNNGLIDPTTGGVNQNITNRVNGVLDGTLNDLSIKAIPYKGEREHILSQAAQVGAQPISKGQQDWVQNLGPSMSVLNTMQKWRDLYKSTPTAVFLNKLDPRTQELDRLRQIIGEGLTSATAQLTSSGRISKDRIDTVKNAFSPSMLQKTGINEQGFDEYARMLDNAFSTKLENLAPAQVNAIKDRIRNANHIVPQTEFAEGPNGHRIVSHDGRKTWYDATTGAQIK